MQEPICIAPWVRCPAGGHPIEVDEKQLVQYFRDEVIACPSCGAVLDWWTTACREIEENFMRNQAFAFIGAQTVIFRLQLKNAERTVYRFSDYGIPSDAKILYVNYTPDGGGLTPGRVS